MKQSLLVWLILVSLTTGLAHATILSTTFGSKAIPPANSNFDLVFSVTNDEPSICVINQVWYSATGMPTRQASTSGVVARSVAGSPGGAGYMVQDYRLALGPGNYFIIASCTSSCGAASPTCTGDEIAGLPSTTNKRICSADCGCGNGNLYNPSTGTCTPACPTTTYPGNSDRYMSSCTTQPGGQPESYTVRTDLACARQGSNQPVCVQCSQGTYMNAPTGSGCDYFIYNDGICRYDLGEPQTSEDCAAVICPSGAPVGECTPGYIQHCTGPAPKHLPLQDQCGFNGCFKTTNCNLA